MPSGLTAADLAADLREILTRGLDLPEATVRFIDSTFSHPSAAELTAIFEEDANSERDSLLALLFSPDESLQIEIESRLGRLQGESPVAEAVAAHLAAASLTVALRFPDGRGVLEVALTPPLARRLVQGLGIDRLLPAGVEKAIATVASGRCGDRLRVMLRNARFDFTPAKSDFLSALIPKLGVRNEECPACFAFALELLAELDASADVYAGFAARKKWLAKALHHGQRLSEHLARSNIETLLSQGQRLTWVDEALLRRRMRFIDRICIAAFGCIPPGDEAGLTYAIDIEERPNVGNLIQRLT